MAFFKVGLLVIVAVLAVITAQGSLNQSYRIVIHLGSNFTKQRGRFQLHLITKDGNETSKFSGLTLLESNKRLVVSFRARVNLQNLTTVELRNAPERSARVSKLDNVPVTKIVVKAGGNHTTQIYCPKGKQVELPPLEFVNFQLGKC